MNIRKRAILSILTVEQKISYEMRGYVCIHNALDDKTVSILRKSIEDISKYKQTTKDKWMHTYSGEKLSRSENFLGHYPYIAGMLMKGIIPELISDCIETDAFVYNETIEYINCGDKDRSPVTSTIGSVSTCLICVDESDTNQIEFGLTHNRHKYDQAHNNDKLEFTPLKISPGDLVFFSSYIPYRILGNSSDTIMRYLFINYNGYEQGYLRDEYYRAKRNEKRNEGQAHALVPFDDLFIKTGRGAYKKSPIFEV